jgi:hypothetical protein
MREQTYRFALDEAAAELKDIVSQFEELKARKEHLEKVVEALRPFIGMQAEAAAPEKSTAYTAPETEKAASEAIEYTFMQITGPGMEVKKAEPAPPAVEQVPEPVAAHALEEATPEQVAYFRQPSADPFQRRIDDALWGWQQRPEGLLSPI